MVFSCYLTNRKNFNRKRGIIDPGELLLKIPVPLEEERTKRKKGNSNPGSSEDSSVDQIPDVDLRQSVHPVPIDSSPQFISYSESDQYGKMSTITDNNDLINHQSFNLFNGTDEQRLDQILKTRQHVKDYKEYQFAYRVQYVLNELRRGTVYINKKTNERQFVPADRNVTQPGKTTKRSAENASPIKKRPHPSSDKGELSPTSSAPHTASSSSSNDDIDDIE